MRFKKRLWILPALVVWIFLTGMGKPPGTEVPVPEMDFKATVIDDQDIATKISRASWNGQIFFSGMRGKGSITISFEKVKKVKAIKSGSGNKSDFQVILKNGAVVAVSFNNDDTLLGITNFGTYSILAKNIKEIIFE